MTINEKIIYFADYLGLTMYKFCKISGLTQGTLSNSKSIGVENLAKIVENFPQLNLEWLMFDKGDMIVNSAGVNENPLSYGKPTSIDAMVDKRIDTKLEALRDTLKLLIRNDITREIEETMNNIKKGKD